MVPPAMLLPECACGAVRPSPLQVQTEPVSHPKLCVKTVSDAPPNLDRTPRRTGHSDFTSLLREVVDQKCVGAFRCGSARAGPESFSKRAPSTNRHFPTFESYACGLAATYDCRGAMAVSATLSNG